MSFGSQRKSTKPSGPKPVTATYLRNAAMHYISAHAASAAMVRDVLIRRAKRRLVVKTLDTPTLDLIDAAIAELKALGLVDDARFAEGRTAVLARKGLSSRLIAHGLRTKGIAKETIEKSVSAGHFDELAQARRLVERKRLGAGRRGGMTPETRRKDLAALARAGFTYAVSAQALDQPEDC
ncbi:MAG: regulatory protein RecX [Hyphomicrobiaceae bacterium]